MKKEHKLLVFDLDETLLRSDKTISNNTLNVLRKCQNKGVLVAICTSRSEIHCQNYIEAIKPDIIVSSSGALIRYKDEFIYKAAFSGEEAIKMIREIDKYCGKLKTTIDTIDNHYWNFNEQGKDGIDKYVYNEFETFDQDSFKICFQMIDDEIIEKMRNDFPDADISKFSDIPWIRITKKEGTKAIAIKKISELLNIPIESIAAFGDDYPDIGMLKEAGVGIAMGNAIEEVKKASDIIIGTNDDEGIANYLKEVYIL